MEIFNNVGINKFKENLEALFAAQEMTNTRATRFRVTYDDYMIEGWISAVQVRSEYFELQLPDGTRTEALEINKLEKIEVYDCWKLNFENNRSFRIYVDDVRPVPAGYIGTKTVLETISLIEYIEENGGTIECLDLDHDLGDFAWLGGDAIKLLDYLVMEEKFYPIKIHTANVVGRENMERTIRRFWP